MRRLSAIALYGVTSLVAAPVRASEPSRDGTQDTCEGDLACGVDRLVDLVYGAHYVWADPIRVGAVARFNGHTGSGGGHLETDGIFFGFQWGRLYFGADTGATLLSDGKTVGEIATLTVARLTGQYLCHADGYEVPAPVVQDALRIAKNPPPPPCDHGERLGYYGELFALRSRPDIGHFAMTLGEAGWFFNVFGTGRTRAAFRDVLTLRLGNSVEHVWPGSVARPASAGADDTAVRTVLGFRLGVSSPGRMVRAAIDGSWRPRIGVWEDRSVETHGDVTVYVAPSKSWVLGVDLTGGFEYGTRPWMTTSAWADPANAGSALAMLSLQLYWSPSPIPGP